MTTPASRRCVLGAARIASAGALLLAGCQTTMMPTVAKVDMPETPVVRPYAQPVPVRANGSIYQASQYRPLFEDHRARLVGDTITVQIIERVSASSNSTSTVEKKGELSGSITALPMLSANSFTRAGVGGSSANTFSGKGGTQNSNNFSGTITATINSANVPNADALSFTATGMSTADFTALRISRCRSSSSRPDTVMSPGTK